MQLTVHRAMKASRSLAALAPQRYCKPDTIACSRARSAYPVVRTVEIRPDLALEKINKLRASSLR